MPQVSFKLIKDKEGQVSKWYPFWVGTVVGFIFVFLAFLLAVSDITRARRMHTIVIDELSTQGIEAIVRRADKSMPTKIAVTAPVEGATISGKQIITVGQTDPTNTLAAVKMFIDGSETVVFGASPYYYEWDTAKVSNGAHLIAVVAIDETGFVTVTHRNVRVQN